MAMRATLLVAVAAFLSPAMASADAAPKLVGSIFSTEKALAKSDAIFIGQLTHFGSGGASGPGECTRFGNTVKVTRILKGSLKAQASVSICYFTDAHEQKMETHQPYVFFATQNSQKNSDQFTVFKLLPVTDTNVASVAEH
jgi:hypothetical protein